MEHFDLDRKYGKPSKTNHTSCGWLTSFENGVWSGCTSQWKTELEPAILKIHKDLSLDFQQTTNGRDQQQPLKQ